MNDGGAFVDYYSVMQVNPNCDAKIIESAYRYLAKVYHPDQAKTADIDKFTTLTEAYRILRDPHRRADYDRSYSDRFPGAIHQFSLEDEPQVDETVPLSDAEMHQKILLSLYKRRREHPSDSGISEWWLQKMLGCSDDSFQFHVWYLKSKGFIEKTEQGTLAVTIDGVDHVISLSRTSMSEKLLIAQLQGPQS